ncbi:MAG: hypothetical protein ACM3SY_15485 [Candidatus Omnitrophota bacterium]
MGQCETIPGMISKRTFMSLPVQEVRDLVTQNQKPVTGIFLADGNRRLTMALTGLSPDCDGFYDAYLTIITGYFKKNLRIFFSHGLTNLFFPLFGSSLLKRNEKYKRTVIPELTRILFEDEAWFRFYRRHDIRIKYYGTPEILHDAFPDWKGIDQITRMVDQTAGHRTHTLYFGFFSDPWGLNHSLPPGSGPDRQGAIEGYYGEAVHPADFFINSTRTEGLGALPPFITGKETRIYTLAAPGVWALDRTVFRAILFDLIFGSSSPPYPLAAGMENDILSLKTFYTKNKHKFIGSGKPIGRFWGLHV